jgi:hypothetical protein
VACKIKPLSPYFIKPGLCAALGNANTVVVVPQLLNGGISFLNGLLGLGSDAIVAARMITASGELLTVSATENHELLYALKGAGQHFGLVTCLTLRAAPLTVLNSDDGTVWIAQAVFSVGKIENLLKALEPGVNDTNPRQGGLVMITKDPMGSGSTVVLCVLYYIGSTPDALAHFGSLKENLMMWTEKRIPYRSINDDFESLAAKGGYKRLQLVGLPRFQSDTEVWEKEVIIYDRMIKRCGSESGAGSVVLRLSGWADGSLEGLRRAHIGIGE